MKMSIGKEFAKYVFLNILGMAGLSCYILADTYFVSARLGSDGLAALNIAISSFNFINGIGLMLGIGGATRYVICREQEQIKEADQVFTQAVFWGLVIGLAIFAAGKIYAGDLAHLLGARGPILDMSAVYLRTIFSFAPFFILNNILIAFVRNDYAPRLAMMGMLSGSFLNILLDYVFIFPMDLGIFGAALATGCAPVLGLILTSTHILRKKNHFHFCRIRISFKKMIHICSLGTSSFLDEISGGIVLIVFNLLMLKFAGNTGVAAYGIIANLALVALAFLIGLSQGTQPLISRFFGQGQYKEVRRVYRYAVVTAVVIGVVVIAIVYGFTDELIRVFNSSRDPELARIAGGGIHLYFTGFLIVGINIVTASRFASTAHPKASLGIASLRGIIGIVLLALLLSVLFGQTGLWLAFPCTEAVTLAVGMILRKILNRKEQRERT